SAVQPGRPAEDIYQNVGAGETAHDASVRDLAQQQNGILARAVADGLFYTTSSSYFSGATWPARDVLAAPTLSLLGAAAVFGARNLRLAGRTRFESVPKHV